jgi:lipopolysaccharide transport system ATP-binding protein
VLLDAGRVEAIGPVQEITNRYLQQGSAGGYDWRRSTPPREPAYFRRVYLCDPQGRELATVTTSDRLCVGLDYTILERHPSLQLGVGLLDANGDEIFGSAPQDAGVASPSEPGDYHAVLSYPPEILMPKRYGIRAALFLPHQGSVEILDNVISFQVEEEASLANNSPGGRGGVLAMRCQWSVERFK